MKGAAGVCRALAYLYYGPTSFNSPFPRPSSGESEDSDTSIHFRFCRLDLASIFFFSFLPWVGKLYRGWTYGFRLSSKGHSPNSLF